MQESSFHATRLTAKRWNLVRHKRKLQTFHLQGIETVTSCKQNTLKVTKEPMNQTSCNKSHTKDQNNLTNQISYFGDYLILSESIQSYNQSLAQETRPNTSKNRSHKRIETIITSTTTKLEIDPYHAQGSGDTPLFLEDDERIEGEESKLKVNKTDDEDLVERGVCLYTMEKLGLNFMNMEEVPILFFFLTGKSQFLCFLFLSQVII